MTVTDELRRAVILHGLADVPWPGAHSDDLTELIAWADRERLTGLLVEQLSQAGQSDERAIAAHEIWLRRSLVIETELARVSGELEAAGLATIVLHGVATAHLDYPTPSMRTFGDADLLIGHRDFAAAVLLLERLGFTPEPSPMTVGWHARYGRALAFTNEAGVEIDLHVRLAPGYLGERIRPDEFTDELDELRLGDVRLRALDGPGRLVTCSLSLVLSRGPRLRLVRDLLEMVSRAPVSAAAALGPEPRLVVNRAIEETLLVVGARPLGRVGLPPLAPRRRDVVTSAAWASSRGWKGDVLSQAFAYRPSESARFLASTASELARSRRSRRRCCSDE